MTTFNQKGMTLLELMIAVAIAGIIASVAYPSYVSYLANGNRADAQSSLEALATAMERFRSDNNTYIGARAAANAASAPIATVFPSQTPIDGTDKKYNLTVEAVTDNSYTLRATPIANTSQDGDGYMELTSTGFKRWDKNDDNDTADADEDNWNK